MKTTTSILLLWLAGSPASATLIDNLVAYYNFEETGTPGLVNKAPGATQYDATRFGGGAFDSSANPSGPGFTGVAAFNGGDGLSNRSTLLAGNALNLVDARGDAITVGLGTASLGQVFTISLWHALTPGASNNSDRYHAFEAGNNFDVSWGTTSVTTTTGPYATYNTLGYVGGSTSPNIQQVLNTGAWNHSVHVFTTSGTDTTLTLYVNGSLRGSFTVATSTMDFTNLHFGRERSSPDPAGDRDWDGLMDEVAIWNRALDNTEVATLYALGQAGQPLSAVPEPATATLLAFGLALAGARFAGGRERRRS